MKIKFLKVTMLILLLATFLIACGNDGDKTNNDNEEGNEGKSEAELNIVDGKIEPAVTITTVMFEDTSTEFRDGESYRDNVLTRWAKEELGVEIDVTWTAPRGDGSYEEKLKLGLAAQEELPDVFMTYDDKTSEMLVESGMVLDIDEAFEKYASDTYKAAIAERPETWWPFIHNDKKYALPVLHESWVSPPVMWVRQDWLDKLDLEAPTNIEQLEIVMDAFANQDPDGNGQDDTIALGISANQGFTVSPVGNASWIFGMFGAIPEIWYPNDDGDLEYGSVQPGIKDALAKLSEWKEKGYISDEMALHDYFTLSEEIASGKVGIVGGPTFFAQYPGSLLMAQNPDALYKPYPIPEGVDGDNMRTTDDAYLGGIFFNKDISEEALQAFFHYQNELYSRFDSDGPYFYNDFQEGYDYVVQDGKINDSEEAVPDGKIQVAKYMVGGKPHYASKEIDAHLYITENEERGFINTLVDEAFLTILEQEGISVPEYFHGPTTPTMSSRWELLFRTETQVFTEIIYGQKPVDAFDDFVEEWNTTGGDKVTEEVNDWYDTVK